MLGKLSDKTQASISEHGFWLTSIDRALSHYGVALAQSSLAYNLTSSNRLVPPFIEQANCNLIWTEAARLADDELFGFRLHRLFTPTVFNMLSLLASASSTPAEALGQLIRFFPVISTQVRLELAQGADEPSLMLVPLGNPHPQQLEAILGYICRLLEQLKQANTAFTTGAIFQRPMKNPEVCRQILGCDEVSFDEQYGVVLSHALLDKPLVTANAFIASRLTEALQDMVVSLPAHDLVEQVKRRVQLLLGSGDISTERIACPMNISPRHLRRKLSQEGTSYEQLVDEVRRETAMRMIGEGQLSLTSIAYELGFLDPSSFTRAFRRWTNMSPTRFRQQVAELSTER